MLSPGYFQERNLSGQVMCVWNISCPEDHSIFVNYTGNGFSYSGESSCVPRPEGVVCAGYEESSECDGEYAVVEWGKGKEVRCAEQHTPWLLNQVFEGSLKVSKSPHKP